MQNFTPDPLEYPFHSHFLNLDGHSLHYLDEGEGETLLFVHGTPSWSFDFRQVIKALQLGYRCVAIDHMGFGLSDKPRQYDYSTLHHAQNLGRLISELQLRDITLVVHDFGGPIGLKIALDHPELIKRVVILNSWLWSAKTDPAYLKLRKILNNPLLPFLYRYLNFSPRFLMPASFGAKKLSNRIRKQYLLPFPDSSRRNGPLAFARSLLHDQDWFESLWQQRYRLQGKPMLLIWGMKDPVLSPAYLEKFAAAFPHAKTLELPTCGHFPQEEEPEAVTEALKAFLLN